MLNFENFLITLYLLFVQRRPTLLCFNSRANTPWAYGKMGCGGKQPFVEDQVLKEIVEDGASGTLQFSVRMHIKADYGISFWLYNMVIKSQCPDLKVEFVAAT